MKRSIRIFPGDCRLALAALPENSVHTVVTSPPYYGLRDYLTEPSIWGGDAACQHEWIDFGSRPVGNTPSPKSKLNGGRGPREGDKYHHSRSAEASNGAICDHCGAWCGNFGLEPTPELYIEHAVEIFRAVRRVLRKDGTLWLNMGDSYVTSPPGNRGKFNPEADRDGAYSRRGNRQLAHGEDMAAIYAKAKASGLKHKDLIGMPWRLALALQADGWWLRQDIIWHKPNPMPESTTDRCTKSHEYLFMLSKSARYYYDQEAIAEPVAATSIVRVSQDSFDDQTGGPKDHSEIEGTAGNSIRKALKNFARSKPAMGGFINTLAEMPPAPSKSGNKKRKGANERGAPTAEVGQAGSVPWAGWTRNKRTVWTIAALPFPGSHFAVFPPALVRPCVLAGSPEGGVIMDPFGGSGTVGMVASQLNRSAILCELNPEYVVMARDRIVRAAGLTLYQCPVIIEGAAQKAVARHRINKAKGSPRQDGDKWNENRGRGFKPRRSYAPPHKDTGG